MDANDQTKEAAKRRLMLICKKICKSSKKAKEIFVRTPICNLRQITKEAKNTKDSNPLMSMMNARSQKFPISVDANKAKMCRIPTEYLGGSDFHTYGRKLCKLDALKWYIENAEPPTAAYEDTIKVLFQGCEKRVEEYFKWDWERSKLYFGEQPLERKYVDTRKPMVEVPRNMRNLYIVASLFPENIVNWTGIDSGLLDQVHLLRNLAVEAKLPILSQIRILATYMDPCTRMIPVLSSLYEEVYPYRHAFCSTNHLIKARPIRQTGQSRKDNEIVETLGKIAAWLLHLKLAPPAIESEMRTITISGVETSTYAGMSGNIGIWADVLRTVFHVPCKLEKDVKGCTFYPQEGRVTSQRQTNAVGTPFYSYGGRESVDARYKGQIYSFRRVGSRVNNMRSPLVSRKDFDGFLARLAVFLKWNFDSSHKRGLKAMTEECFQKASREPWVFLGSIGECSISRARYLESIANGTNFAQVEFVRETSACSARQCDTNFEGTMIKFENGTLIPVHKPPHYPCLNVDSVTKSHITSMFQPPTIRLRELLAFYTHPKNYPLLVRHIRSNDFNWENEGIRIGVTGSMKTAIHASARKYIYEMISNPDNLDIRFIALCYCFAETGTEVVSSISAVRSFTWFGELTVSFFMDVGIARLHLNEMAVDGVTVSRSHTGDNKRMIAQFAQGWRLIDDPGYQVPVKPTMFIHRGKSNEGDIIKINLYGMDHFMIRDSHAAQRMASTLQRQLDAFEALTVPGGAQNFVERVKRVAEEQGNQPVKKLRTFVDPEDSDEELVEIDSDNPED